MKLLVLLLCLIPASLFAQYEFIPADSAVWTGRSMTECGPGCSSSNWTQVYTDTITPDTLINSTLYKTLRKNTASANGEYYLSYRIDSVEKAIYFVPEDSLTEYLYFDFDQHALGDTVLIHHIPYIETPEISSCNYKLFLIGNIDIGGTIYEFFEFDLIMDSLASVNSCGDNLHITERNISGFAFPFTPRYIFETIYDNRCYSESGVNKWVNGAQVCPYAFYANTISVDELSQRIKVFPVPSHDYLSIQGLSEPAKYFIYDQSGRMLIYDNTNGSEVIDIQILRSGVYILKIETSAMSRTIRFVKN